MTKNEAILSMKELEAINNILGVYELPISHIVIDEEYIILHTLDSNISYELMYVGYAMKKGIKYLYLDESTGIVLVRVTK